MKLIREMIEEPVRLVTEGEGAAKRTRLEGIAAQAGVPNKNKRFYPPSILEREINKYVIEKVKTGGAMGELSHPQNPGLNLDRVSHIFKEVRREGNNWIGSAELTPTPMGAIAEGIITAGGRLGFSTRGVGTLRPTQNGYDEVGEDYRLMVLADLVADPSAPEAWARCVHEGAAEWKIDERGNWVQAEKLADVEAEVKKTTDPDKFLMLFERFMDVIGQASLREDGHLMGMLAARLNKSPERVAEAWSAAKEKARVVGRSGDTGWIYNEARRRLES